MAPPPIKIRPIQMLDELLLLPLYDLFCSMRYPFTTCSLKFVSLKSVKGIGEAKSKSHEQAEYLPFFDIERNSFDGGEVAIVLDEILNFENGWHEGSWVVVVIQFTNRGGNGCISC